MHTYVYYMYIRYTEFRYRMYVCELVAMVSVEIHIE